MSENLSPFHNLIEKIELRSLCVGIIGMGYVGLPLALAFSEKGVRVLGLDIDARKSQILNLGQSYIKSIPSDYVKNAVESGNFFATADMSRIRECDALLICVPTPLSKHLEPDLSYVIATAETISLNLRCGQIVILESTTYPGTTQQIVQPILENSGLQLGREFFLAYSPEREDPGNAHHTTALIPKVVGADDPNSVIIADKLYALYAPQTVPVSSSATAEAVKITENVFRSVNIALVNELKLIYDAMGIDVWEVIDAAKTKPFGFMPFYPGPGLGGHCIPIDPFYLTWKAREYGHHTRFIELAGQINTAMPEHVVTRLAHALDSRFRRGLNGSLILVCGVAYKKNVDDTRESPSLRIIELLEARGAVTEYHDPFVPEIGMTREHPLLAGRVSVPLTAATLSSYDAVLIATDHDDVDYSLIVDHAKLVVDTRNACAAFPGIGENVIKA